MDAQSLIAALRARGARLKVTIKPSVRNVTGVVVSEPAPRNVTEERPTTKEKTHGL